jgi:hypothetical protein
MNLKKSFYLFESTFFYHQKAYGTSPTDLEKIWLTKICFRTFLGLTMLIIDKAICRQAIQLAQNRNNFQTHFQYDFSKYCICPMEYISQNKGKIQSLQKTVKFCPRKVFRFLTLKN